MALASGTRLGPYELLSPAGAGGMGEVYRARDTRLDRTVAIKVLPSQLSQNPDVRQRFEREAKAISALSHPNICPLYDVGNESGVDFLVMEFLEGETLEQRLQKGPLPTEQVLRYGIEIADALEKAHRLGIIHRDLKPGNIMLTKGGAKLMDFGLAKTTGPAPVAQALTEMTAEAKKLTAEGTILGTFQYMAPEQLEGAETSAVTDLFALGEVLYEMATGKPAFAGRTKASLIAAILSSDPKPIGALAPLTPPALERVIRTCLAKEPEERWQTAHDLKLQLQWIAEGGSQAGVPAPVAARRRTRERLAWGVAALLFVGLALAVTGYVLRAPQPRRAVRVSLLAPPNASFQPFDFALSPDGTKLAFVATGPNGRPQLWVRSLDSTTGQPLAGTEGAGFPFWSPDSHQIGFFASGKIKRTDAAGGAVQLITDAAEGRGGAWSPDGTIVFAPSTAEPLLRVPASGGVATPLTSIDSSRSETSHRWPWFLPDGRHFIFLVRTGGGVVAKKPEESGNGIYVSSLDSPDRRQLLVRSDRRAMYASGHVLFIRSSNLMAQRLDTRKLKMLGDAVPVAEQVAVDDRWTGAFTVSDDGKLAFQSGGAVGYALIWYDRTGKPGAVVANDPFNVTRLSPDGRKVAASVSDQNLGTLDIWIYDLGRGVKTRFTFDAADEDDPVWSPDGNTIVFDSARKGAYNLYQKPANGAHPEEPLYEDKASKYPTSWSSDGKYVIFDRSDPEGKTKYDLWVLPMFGDHKPFPFLQTQFDERLAEFSPDTKWVAYVSNESGREEVYAVSFPTPGGRFQVSAEGGSNPKWRADGKELFYLDASNRVVAVPVTARGDSLEIGAPQTLFQTHVWSRGYFLSSASDGKRFLIVENPQINASSLTLVLNWDAALEK
jgi:Tol biopolymer transport system component/predicted Ser/Thr protein kinase